MSQAPPDFDRFFADYAAAFNRSLGERVDVEPTSGAFTARFLHASPAGVQTGSNDASFRDGLVQGYAFYRQIGTKRMSVRRVEAQPLDPLHHQVRVFWRAEYDKPGTPEPVVIDFDVVYLLQTLPGDQPKIFAYIAGDEMAELKKHGLIPKDAKPPH